MKKTVLYFFVFYLFSNALKVNAQTPQIQINGGVSGSGSITLKMVKSTGENFSFTYTLNASTNPFLDNLPEGIYSMYLSNNTNKEIGFIVCQSPQDCDVNQTNYSCEGIDTPIVDGTSLTIGVGVNNYLLANNYKIISNSKNGKNCITNSSSNYTTGAVKVTLFNQFTDSIKLIPLNYTDGTLFIQNNGCASKAQTHIWVNDKELTNYTVLFAGYGLFNVQYPFGAIKAGDIVYVTNDCGGQPSPHRVAKDVNYYIIVPDGISYKGNAITDTDSLPPSARLNTPVEVKQCDVIPLSSKFHAYFSFGIFQNPDGTPSTSGPYKINDRPVKDSDLIFTGNINNSHYYAINPNGSITITNDSYFVTNKMGGYSIPYSLEYQHDGSNDGKEHTIFMNNSGFAFINSNDYRTFKYIYADHPNHIFTAPSPTSKYKLEFYPNKLVYKVNDQKIDSVIYGVTYSIVGGSGTISNNQSTDIGVPINFIPQDTGTYAIQAKFSNGVIIQQKFHVSPNAPTVNPTIATIYSGNTVNLIGTGCSGTVVWGNSTPPVTGNLYPVSPTKTTTYTALCETTTGCRTLGTNATITVKAPPPIVNTSDVCQGNPVILTASGCLGGIYTWTGNVQGSSISVTPSISSIYSVICTNEAGTSIPTQIKISIK